MKSQVCLFLVDEYAAKMFYDHMTFTLHRGSTTQEHERESQLHLTSSKLSFQQSMLQRVSENLNLVEIAFL